MHGPLNVKSMESLSQKLTVPQPVKKFPSFYGTQKFITAFTGHRHLFLPSAIQSSHPIY